MSDDRGSKFLIGALAASIANKRAKEQREATERMAEAQEEANRIALRQQEKQKKQTRRKPQNPEALYLKSPVQIKDEQLKLARRAKKKAAKKKAAKKAAGKAADKAIVTGLNGHHRYTYANGDKYVGEWQDGKNHGQGTFTNTWLKYVGEYKDGKHHGQGTISANGNKYVGEWKDGNQHGQGTFTGKNGDEYMGEWENGNPNGQGIKTYANGDKFVGEWKNDTYHGQGTYAWADGSVEKGIWKNGQFINQNFIDRFIVKIFKKFRGELITESDFLISSISRSSGDKKSLTIEDELLKIKELYEKDLITEEVYKARQISIMESYKH